MKFMNKNGGFTLVELIVVIAILAILAGVAVPAYSGYVDKANQSADIALVRDVEHALTLAGYSGTIKEGESGYITLSTAGPRNIAAGSNVEIALQAVFGANYAESLKLTYDKWSSSGVFNGMTGEDAELVTYSSYMTGGRKDVLLSDVEKMTGMAQNLVTALAAGGGAAEGAKLSELFGNALNETATKYGITLPEGQDWETWGASEANKNAYSNLLVLTAADEMEKSKTAQNAGESYTMSTASNMILEFSSFYGFAAQNAEFSKEMDTFMAQLNDGKTVTSVATGKDWYVNLQNKAKEYGYDNYNSSTTGANQGEADRWAFQSIMAGLGNPTEEQAANIASDLNNANLFTDGVVNNMYNDYLDAVEVMVGLGTGSDDTTFDVGSGEVAIMFVAKNGGVSVSSSLPTK